MQTVAQALVATGLLLVGLGFTGIAVTIAIVGGRSRTPDELAAEDEAQVQACTEYRRKKEAKRLARQTKKTTKTNH